MEYRINEAVRPVVVSVESITLTLTPAEFLALDTLRYHFLGGLNPLEEPMREIHEKVFGSISYSAHGGNVIWSKCKERAREV